VSQTIDYNPEGPFSVAEVQRRYAELCTEFRISAPLEMTPFVHSGKDGRNWIYSIMQVVADGVKTGDKACIELAVQYIVDEGRYPFAMATRSNMARYLRKVDLSHGQKDRLRRRFIGMLQSGQFGREFREYSRLFISIGADEYKQTFLELSGSPKKYVARAANYLLDRLRQGS
jgi:hypothetical protein